MAAQKKTLVVHWSFMLHIFSCFLLMYGVWVWYGACMLAKFRNLLATGLQGANVPMLLIFPLPIKGVLGTPFCLVGLPLPGLPEPCCPEGTKHEGPWKMPPFREQRWFAVHSNSKTLICCSSKCPGRGLSSRLYDLWNLPRQDIWHKMHKLHICWVFLIIVWQLIQHNHYGLVLLRTTLVNIQKLSIQNCRICCAICFLIVWSSICFWSSRHVTKDGSRF